MHFMEEYCAHSCEEMERKRRIEDFRRRGWYGRQNPGDNSGDSDHIIYNHYMGDIVDDDSGDDEWDSRDEEWDDGDFQEDSGDSEDIEEGDSRMGEL